MHKGDVKTVAFKITSLNRQMNRYSRVLLCCENYPPSVGGVQEVMRQIAERFASFGLQVTVATSSHPDRICETVRCGVRIVSFPITGNLINGMNGPIENYHSFLANENFDLILIKAAQQWTFDAAVNILPSLIARKFFVPCGFSRLEDSRYIRYYQDMPCWLRLFDGLIFYSSEYQDIAFARKHGLKNIHCLTNGVDEREFADLNDHNIRSRLGISESHDLLLSVGTQIAAKGHWEVLRAFSNANLLRPATLVINGNIPAKCFFPYFKQIIKLCLTGRWPLKWEVLRFALFSPNKRVIITDIPRSALVDLYKAADLFIFASHVEYSPLVLFEAAAAGTAFIASPAGNSREIAQWTEAGCILEKDFKLRNSLDIRELAQKIETMIADKSQLIAIGRRGRNNIFTKNFTWDKIAYDYLSIMTRK